MGGRLRGETLQIVQSSGVLMYGVRRRYDDTTVAGHCSVLVNWALDENQRKNEHAPSNAHPRATPIDNISPFPVSRHYCPRLLILITVRHRALTGGTHLSHANESPSYPDPADETVVSGQGRSFPAEAVSAARARMGKTIHVNRTHRGSKPII